MTAIHILFWSLIIVLLYATMNGYWMACFALFRRRVGAAGERYAQRPIMATLLGAFVLAPLAILAVAALNSGMPAVATAGLLLLSILIMLALLGCAGLACQIGSRMGAAPDRRRTWHQQLRGGLVLGLCFALPLLGWMVLMPWALICGFGAALMALAERKPADPAAPASTRSLPKVDPDSDDGEAEHAE